MSEEGWKGGADGSWDFGAIGEGFDAHVRRHLPGYELVEQLAVSAPLWNVYEGARVLDIGCATGTTLAALARRSRVWFDGRGIDVEQDMVNAALVRFGDALVDDQGSPAPTLSAYQLDATHLGIEPTARVLGDEPFDVVFALFSHDRSRVH